MSWSVLEADLLRSVPGRSESFREPRSAQQPRAGGLHANKHISISNSSIEITNSSSIEDGGVSAELCAKKHMLRSLSESVRTVEPWEGTDLRSCITCHEGLLFGHGESGFKANS